MNDDAALDALEQRLRRLATPQSTDVHTQAADAIAALRAERAKMLAVIEAAKALRERLPEPHVHNHPLRDFDAALAALEEA